jgi:SAM-dependent methyltransferase
MSVDTLACRICEAGRLEPIAGFEALPRVTSDCKPWPAGGKLACCDACGAVQKIADATWFAEIKHIYGAYQIYSLSDGAEQVIFTDGVAQPRSRTLVDFVVRHAKNAEAGKLIDIGCGNGAALRNFSGALPEWQLYGSELSGAARASLATLPNFVDLFTGPIEWIGERFDMVTMIHSLEHMPDPLATLRGACQLLGEGGALFVEVPNVATSMFDLLVADHLLHFSPAHLGYLAARAGFSVDTLLDDLLPKEITLLARRGDAVPQRPDPIASRRLVEANVAWLAAVVRRAAESARGAHRFGLFGTAISGMWLYGAMKDQVSFFVDEDVTRIGRSCDGRPILAPAQVPAGSTVFVPLIPIVARQVVQRYVGSSATFVAATDGAGGAACADVSC